MKRLAAMGACRLSLYLAESGADGFWATHPHLLDRGMTRADLQQMEEGYLASIAAEGGSLGRLFALLSPQDAAGRLAWCALELAVLYHMDGQIGAVFGGIEAESGGGATLGLAAKLLYGEAAALEQFALMQEAYARCALLLLGEYPPQTIAKTILRADDRLVEWMERADSTLRHPLVRAGAPVPQPSCMVWEEKRLALLRELRGTAAAFAGETVIAAISGKANSGRKYLVRQTAEALGKPLLLVEMSYLGGLDTLLAQWRRVLREIVLQPVLLCVTGVEKQPAWETMLRILVREYEAAAQFAWQKGLQDAPALRPLFFITAEDVKLIPLLEQRVVQAHLPMPDLVQRGEIWAFFAENYLQRALPAAELAVKMKLPIGDVEKVAKRLVCRPREEAWESREIFRYCYELLDDGRYDTIKRVEATYTFDDLKLEESQKQVIRDICAQVEYRKKVLRDWGLQSRYSYGTSVSALFSGPPGTGKTMAVHVMAGILGLELFKVDLSQVVDKYVGETEKRLEEVFQRAEQSNMILFFDEADALIGKRSETKEAKDKYANTEVAYLLQRMEEYDGIVILATNYSQNIDAAFMRRIRFTVHFPLPDEATRKEIWQSAFAADTPCGKLDFDYLSRQFEFSGGQIKNVVWNACFFAAAEEAPVEMRHMVRAIQMELTKEKKISFQEALGAYAHLVY